jgi:hypothetical protein
MVDGIQRAISLVQQVMIDSVLYVGSGLSALQANEYRGKVDVCCSVNNAWRALMPTGSDYWIYPGDFPPENFPPNEFKHQRISYDDFQNSAERVFARLGQKYVFPQHKAGYTIFFQGLYWIFDNLKPKRIYTIGFDHDYSAEKVRKWIEHKCPAPNNKFNGDSPVSVKDWSDNFFSNCPEDSIYGHGTPDPWRLGIDELTEFFNRALECSSQLGIALFNASGITNGLNNFPQGKP